MKTLFSIVLLSFLLCAIFASAPPPTHASDWVDDLISCTGNYINGSTNAWDTWYSSSHGPGDLSQRDYALDVAFDNFQGCNSVVDIPYAAIDFCPAAQQAYYNCGIQFQGIDDTFARMECEAATHYDGTCR
ncbi:MAG TPA: hypothetical protein VKB05_03035 [Pyrinomonadaceae bacterium]|nr:hypothetical protein [Pyrinomonadaceae bacterium]